MSIRDMIAEVEKMEDQTSTMWLFLEMAVRQRRLREEDRTRTSITHGQEGVIDV